MERLKDADPKRIGAVAIRGRLGNGGMGRVYFGVTDDGDAVAVKVIREDLLGRDEVRGRFARELDALRSVQSPHVASLLAASDEDEEKPWLAIEYIRGLNLKELIEERGPLGAEQTAILGLLLTKALADIHAAELLHRDLKPGNILMGREGPKVIDLGLAAFLDGPTDLTSSQFPLGTPACMSPEQITTPRSLTAAVDVYALGATLMFVLTGRFPFHDRVAIALMHKITDPTTPPDLSGVPEPFEPFLRRMLAFDPAARPAVTELHDWFTQLIGGQVPPAIGNLAVATYVERDSDPLEPTPPQRPQRKDLSSFAPPGSVIHKLAERLRTNYASTARF
ncbi:serine/threonine-protein kinase [Nocardia tengchongensis]|uniref:serine/threonine-protein kinase n=1 Tax=Nocardia tengchongensis TaxID=2055889 RepID=UPI0036891679